MDEQNPHPIVPPQGPNDPNQQIMQPNQGQHPQQVVAVSVGESGQVAKASHGGVTALGVIATVFGSIGLLGSFIPCLGALAIYIAVPATICGIIGIVLANKHKVSLALPTVGLVLSAIGGVIAIFQIMAINEAANEVDEAFEDFGREMDRIERLSR